MGLGSRKIGDEGRQRAEICPVNASVRRTDAPTSFYTASAESGQAWDAVALVRYPSRRAFADMVQDSDYREKAGPLREASLAEAVLQPTWRQG